MPSCRGAAVWGDAVPSLGLTQRPMGPGVGESSLASVPGSISWLSSRIPSGPGVLESAMVKSPIESIAMASIDPSRGIVGLPIGAE